MGGSAYSLDLPDCMHQVHNVFHDSLIKPYRSDGRTQPPPPPELVDDCPEWTVEQVLDHRVVTHTNSAISVLPISDIDTKYVTEYALQTTREETHYCCALAGALQHQGNTFVSTLLA